MNPAVRKSERLSGTGLVDEIAALYGGYGNGEALVQAFRRSVVLVPRRGEEAVLTGDHDGIRPIGQTERIEWREAPQSWVDERFYGIVTDLVGTPAELVDPDGGLVWYAINTLWGHHDPPFAGANTPLRFPGQ